MKKILILFVSTICLMAAEDNIEQRIDKEAKALAEGVKLFGLTDQKKILERCRELSKTSLLWVKGREQYFEQVAEKCVYYANK